MQTKYFQTGLTPGRRQSKTLILSTNVDQKWIETEFSLAICRLTGDQWQSKTLFLRIFDPRSSIVKNVFDCRLPCVGLLLTAEEQHLYRAVQRPCSLVCLNSLHAWKFGMFLSSAYLFQNTNVQEFNLLCFSRLLLSQIGIEKFLF